MIGILGRLNISRWAVWGQVEHRKVWRSIPHTVVVSVWTSIRRISAPHAKHFIAAPGTPLLTVLMVAKSVPTVAWGVLAVAVENCAVEARNQSVRI
jgi:hypothetical protein